MSFKNFLDLRKKTRQQTQIIERVVFQKRSIKSDIFLALSVILVASAIIWGISKAQETILEGETPNISQEATVIESITIPTESVTEVVTDEVVVPTEVVTDEVVAPKTEEASTTMAGQDEENTEIIIETSTGTDNTSTTTNILENIIDSVTGIGNQIVDSVGSVIYKVTDIITGTSTPKITEEPLPTIEVTEQDTDTGKLVTISSSDENNCKKLLEKENFLSSLYPESTKELTNTIANVFSSLTNIFASNTNQETGNLTEPTPGLIPKILPEQNIEETASSTETSNIIENIISTENPTSTPNTEKSEYEQCLQKEVHLTNVLASTTIPEIYKVGEESKIKIKWQNNGDQEMSFFAFDTDLNGYLDYVEWTVPHLSTQVFEIIFISKAFQLDQDKNIISDIYDTVKEQDGNFATINDGQYVRVTFEEVLDNTKDITVYAKPSSVIPVQTGIHAELSDWIPASAGMTDVGENDNAGAPSTNYSLPTTHSIEVYPVYTDQDGNKTEGPKLELVSDNTNPDFSNINENTKYRILLSNLETPTDEFDLKVVSTNYSLQTTN